MTLKKWFVSHVNVLDFVGEIGGTIFFGSAVLSVFLAIRSNLELETAIPTVLQNYGVRIFHLP